MRMLLLLAAVGCSEYSIQGTQDDNLGTEPELDTAEPEPETTPESDTAEPVDTGSPNDEGPPPAEAPVYAHTSGELYEVDPASGARTLIGTFRSAAGVEISPFVDIAIDLDGRMYGGTFDALYSIDPFTAQVTEICMPDAGMIALTFTSDGELIAGDSDGVNIINIANCRVTELVTDVATSISSFAVARSHLGLVQLTECQ